LADLQERAARWGVARSYSGYKGDVIESPASTVEAILEAIATEDAPPAEPPHAAGGPCAAAPDRAWGWAVQLYAVRSRESWGIGDLADLRRLGRWARGAGASVLLISPLGAQPPTPRQEPCPYYSSSRRFRNPLYLRVEEIAGADACMRELEPLQAAAHALNQERHIDHDAVFRLKTQALEIVFRAQPAPKGLATWARSQGRALRDFATFNAIAEIHGATWRSWSESFRHPTADAIARVQRELAPRIEFHTWAQYHVHVQLMKAAREIALIADVPVGFAADGFDAWRWQDLLVPGMRVGAPPDYFFPDGQDWGMPAFDPWKLRAARFEPFVEALRSATAHAGGLRLDHVMSLFRLFWIPAGATPAAGTYVHYPSQPMVEILASESRRSGAFMIGEDLGVVEPEVRTTMHEKGALGYRLFWFDDLAPSQWPKDSVAAISTHDLPTVAGIWKRTEPDERQHHLRDRLAQTTGLPDASDPLEVAVAAYTAVASSPSRIALATLEDALRVEERPNIPGTTSEWPNWRLALPVPLEDIEKADGPARIAEVMTRAHRADRRAN
jgi:4-alpha-glucanotransferase